MLFKLTKNKYCLLVVRIFVKLNKFKMYLMINIIYFCNRNVRTEAETNNKFVGL